MCFNSCSFDILKGKKSDFDRTFNSCSLGIFERKAKIHIQNRALKRPWP
jgi:hypothetical protein